MPADSFIEGFHATDQVGHMLPWIGSTGLNAEVRAAAKGPMCIDRAATIRSEQRTRVLLVWRELFLSARSHALSGQQRFDARHDWRFARDAKVTARRAHLALARQGTLLDLGIDRTQSIELGTKGIGLGHKNDVAANAHESKSRS